MDRPGEVTTYLRGWSAGDKEARDRTITLVYDELHRIAERIFAREGSEHTLQPTALLNEAYLKLAEAEIEWVDRTHFYALSARLMRRLLVNHAEAKRAAKRGGDAQRVPFEDELHVGRRTDPTILELHEAIQSLSAADERKAELVELKYFGGLTVSEIETVTGLSATTIGRELRYSKAWLKEQLQGGAA